MHKRANLDDSLQVAAKEQCGRGRALVMIWSFRSSGGKWEMGA